MARSDDLAQLKAIQHMVKSVDLTPGGALTATGPGPVISNPFNTGFIHLEQIAGVGAMDVRIEGSNTRGLWKELWSSTELLGANSSEVYDLWKGLAFLRLNVISLGSGGQVTGTMVSR